MANESNSGTSPSSVVFSNASVKSDMLMDLCHAHPLLMEKSVLNADFGFDKINSFSIAIVASVSPSLVSFMGDRVVSLSIRDYLSRISKGTKSIIDYMQLIQSGADEIAMLDSPFHHEELTPIILSGVGDDFKEISAAAVARKNSQL
ncbi:hypothetical protein FEM48_Zijuj12G0157100 [Ziziphus jujuba var. spinosa]|uniref:Uncharacterized protein n=1 Tax=Ziziphus jujuba var. spinosa TaxID=714518 RepID=A0A978UE73_ZIZJJ|nr:hypothetical protein FEM48_Zijuj12G0157100 [Ziziphus jujuba var. spinosa]